MLNGLDGVGVEHIVGLNWVYVAFLGFLRFVR